MKKLIVLIATAALTACSLFHGKPEFSPAGAAITADSLLAHVKVLASDSFEGRLPGTRGEEKTVAYLASEFRKLGLKPGNPDGSYAQKVPLVGITGSASGALRVKGKTLAFAHGRDYMASTTRFARDVRVKNSPLVFVGYGAQAPEYGWDDYKGLDVKGKTLVMLINDPATDAALFKGKAMTYYGRWTYKYEIASKLGAEAVLIVHEDEPASYPWSVVQSSWSGEQFELDAADQNAGNVAVQGWMTRAKAVELFAAAGQDFEALKASAQTAAFQPVALNAQADFQVRNKIRRVQSRNVVARIPGSDPKQTDEYVIYTAHWDHLGRDRSLKGDQIFNGAVDNATGTAGLLEIAKAYMKLPQAPARSVLFLAVTAEEQGLLGSAWYARHPLYPHTSTVAVINMDSLNPWGPTRDVQVIGYGQNSLEDVLKEHAAVQNRVLVGDTQTEKGFYYRSDQFSFAKHGVPALYADGGVELLGQPADAGRDRGKEYTAKHYHQTGDEVRPDWDLSGAAQDLQLLFETGRHIASCDHWPEWKKGSEFKAIREQSLKK